MMSVRRQKLLLLFAAALLLVAAGLTVWRGVQEGHVLRGVAPYVLFAAVLAIMWTQASRVEAEHGPDYRPPVSPHQRTILVVAAIAAVGLTAIATVMLLR